MSVLLWWWFSNWRMSCGDSAWRWIATSHRRWHWAAPHLVARPVSTTSACCSAIRRRQSSDSVALPAFHSTHSSIHWHRHDPLCLATWRHRVCVKFLKKYVHNWRQRWLRDKKNYWASVFAVTDLIILPALLTMLNPSVPAWCTAVRWLRCLSRSWEVCRSWLTR